MYHPVLKTGVIPPQQEHPGENFSFSYSIMKKILFLLCILIIRAMFISHSADAQTFYWSNQIGGIYKDTGGAGCCDNEGNFYFAGMFWSTECFFQSDTLIRQGINDLFLVK